MFENEFEATENCVEDANTTEADVVETEDTTEADVVETESLRTYTQQEVNDLTTLAVGAGVGITIATELVATGLKKALTPAFQYGTNKIKKALAERQRKKERLQKALEQIEAEDAGEEA